MVFQGHAGSPILINNNGTVYVFYNKLRLNKQHKSYFYWNPNNRKNRSKYIEGNVPFLIKDSFSHLLLFYLRKRHFFFLIRMLSSHDQLLFPFGNFKKGSMHFSQKTECTLVTAFNCKDFGTDENQNLLFSWKPVSKLKRKKKISRS